MALLAVSALFVIVPLLQPVAEQFNLGLILVVCVLLCIGLFMKYNASMSNPASAIDSLGRAVGSISRHMTRQSEVSKMNSRLKSIRTFIT